MGFWGVLLALLAAVWAVQTVLWRWAHARRWLRATHVPHRRDGPPPRVLGAIAVAMGCAGLLALLLLARAWQSDTPLWLDIRAAELARAAWSTTGHAFWLPITHLADPIALWMLAAVAGAWLWSRGRIALLLAWLGALAGNALCNPALKRVFERVRPEADLSGLAAPGYSFPSGHSSGAMVAYGMLAYLAWRLLPPRWHLPVLWAVGALVLCIGASRVYLQAHFASDVLAGFASGGAWLAVCIALSGCWQARRR
jgi:undecaprenyl-diphosphatase